MPRRAAYPLSPETSVAAPVRTRCQTCRRSAAVHFLGRVLCGDCFLQATRDAAAGLEHDLSERQPLSPGAPNRSIVHRELAAHFQ
jgi:hypothetical protein